MEKPKDCQDIFLKKDRFASRWPCFFQKGNVVKCLRKSKTTCFIFRKGGLRAVNGAHFGFGQRQYATAGIEKR
ncbi:MAG: hypothetical protein M1418_03615 [Deltaproteobacteria bacterium]|nr:hypothetical protein [Deltaproteobacteria bacterium]